MLRQIALISAVFWVTIGHCPFKNRGEVADRSVWFVWVDICVFAREIGSWYLQSMTSEAGEQKCAVTSLCLCVLIVIWMRDSSRYIYNLSRLQDPSWCEWLLTVSSWAVLVIYCCVVIQCITHHAVRSKWSPLREQQSLCPSIHLIHSRFQKTVQHWHQDIVRDTIWSRDAEHIVCESTPASQCLVTTSGQRL